MLVLCHFVYVTQRFHQSCLTGVFLTGVCLTGDQVKEANLRHTLSFGVGLHHAGLAESDRVLVETLFEQCKIQVRAPADA